MLLPTVACALALGAMLPAVSPAATVVLGPSDLTVPSVAGASCRNATRGSPCAWGAALNTALAGGAPFVAPADGRLTSWRVAGVVSGDGILFANVLRPGPGGSYTVVASTANATAFDGVTPNPASIAVQRGDTIDVVTQNPNYLTLDGSAEVRAAAVPGSVWATIGILRSGTDVPDFPTDGQQLLYNATIELEPPRIDGIVPAHGPIAGGTTVTIVGGHLASVTGVTFGDVPAQSFAGDDTAVTAVSPAHADGPVTIRLTTAGGTATASFGYDDVTTPALSHLTLAPAAFRAANLGGPVVAAARRRRGAPIGARVRYSLSEPATTTFTVARALSGRRSGRRCAKPSRGNRGARACKRFVVLRPTFAHAGVAGANGFTFSGRLGGRPLRAGGYRLTAVAADAVGHVSPAAGPVPFRIVRSGR